MNSELKKVIDGIKSAQTRLQTLVKDSNWMEEARKYAERQSTEVKKLFSADVDKVKTFLERERKELERFQKQLPGEVKKLRNLMETQRKEFEKLLATVRKAGTASGKVKSSKAKATKKKTTSKLAVGAKKKVSSKKSASTSA